MNTKTPNQERADANNTLSETLYDLSSGSKGQSMRASEMTDRLRDHVNGNYDDRGMAGDRFHRRVLMAMELLEAAASALRDAEQIAEQQ